MSEMDFERSWFGIALGGEWEPVPWKEKEGRAPVTELSARDLSCSDQLKPNWSFPGLPPVRKFLMALLPPKLMWRTKGVVGAVLGPLKASSSSMTFSSMESELFELVDMLPRRMKEELFEGEVPERPMVVIDRRRLCESTLPLLEKGGPLEPLDGPRWNRLDKAAWVIELRRWPEPGPGPFVSDIALLYLLYGGVERRNKV